MTEITTALDTALRPRSSRKGSYKQRHGCPAWCETEDHHFGELRHITYQEVACSLHPKEAGLGVEAVRAHLVGSGFEQWYQQNEAMTIGLLSPPGAAEPYIEVHSHSDFDGMQPTITRLSLAEGAELARTLLEQVAAGRGVA